MLISGIEDKIKERIKKNISGLAIESFPEDFDKYLKTFLHPKGAILVTYKGSSYSKPEGLGLLIQDETLEFTIVTILRHLKDSSGAHPIIEGLKDILKGYRIAGCTKIYPKKIDFLDESYGKWIYSMDITLSQTDIEKEETEESAKLIKVTYQEDSSEYLTVTSN